MIYRQRHAIASAPAKVILFGEHFVVYDNPAILVSVNRRIEVKAEIRDTSGIKVHPDSRITNLYEARGSDSKALKSYLRGRLFPVYNAVSKVIKEYDSSYGIDLQIRSRIPIGIGLGSSASVCVASIAAVSSLFQEPDRRSVCAKATESEALIHKISSGADCCISTFGGIIYYIKSAGFTRIQSPEILHLVLANTRTKHSTGSLVSLVNRFRHNNKSSFQQTILRAAEICKQGKRAIRLGDTKYLGKLMTENHRLLQLIGVSNEKTDRIVDICNANGALGAKLTGAGGGGSVIALVGKKQQSKLRLAVQNCGCELLPLDIEHRGLILH
jgi:mevalonate kinase